MKFYRKAKNENQSLKVHINLQKLLIPDQPIKNAINILGSSSEVNELRLINYSKIYLKNLLNAKCWQYRWNYFQKDFQNIIAE